MTKAEIVLLIVYGVGVLISLGYWTAKDENMEPGVALIGSGPPSCCSSWARR